MSNYIEGEISFDILDDDDLPDIATSSRQDFLDDERVELLIDIVDPILKALFNLRIDIGQTIREENEKYTDYLIKLEEKKRKEEEEDPAGTSPTGRSCDDLRTDRPADRTVRLRQRLFAGEKVAGTRNEHFKVIHAY